MKSLVIGDVSVDTIVHLATPLTSAATHFPVDTYQRIGGSAAGKALNLDYFHREVDLITRIGRDSVGKTIQDRFKDTGVTPHFIETLKRPSPTPITWPKPPNASASLPRTRRLHSMRIMHSINR